MPSENGIFLEAVRNKNTILIQMEFCLVHFVHEHILSNHSDVKEMWHCARNSNSQACEQIEKKEI